MRATAARRKNKTKRVGVGRRTQEVRVMSFRDSWGWKGAGVGREDHIDPHEDSGFLLEEKEASGGFQDEE